MSTSSISSASSTATTQSTSTSSSQASADGTKLNDDLNSFMTLLVTQLQNQDPLDPMDSSQFTQQLVQFASVEQQIKQNGNLEKLITGQQQAALASMVGYLGQSVEVNGNQLSLNDGQAEASYKLDKAVQETTLVVSDSLNRVVYSEAGETDAGTHSFKWNGQNSSGQTVPDGTYKLSVVAVDSNGDLADVSTSVVGRVKSAGLDNGDITLDFGGFTASIDDVIAVKPQTTSDE